MESSSQPSSLAIAESLLSRYPTSALLLEYAETVVSVREMALLPSATVEADVIALRIAELMLALNLPFVDSKEGLVSSSESEPEASIFTADFLPTHRMFFDAVCEAMSSSRTVRVTIMGPTFLLPDFIHFRRDREKPGRNFTRELKEKLSKGEVDFAYVVFRNSPERFMKMVGSYVKSNKEFERAINETIENLEMTTSQRIFPSLQFRCVDTGYMHIPHIFDSVALLASRRSPETAVDGGWVVRDRPSLDMEKARFDRVFEGTSQTQSMASVQLRRFLESLL
ncbi:hypothetical protein [Nocardiopsis changdeensis]|uniref:hypothetical protein n=1 Tax=Nocardiopsis changdeensis TaxID=2831969 RepID=UPI003F45BCC7